MSYSFVELYIHVTLYVLYFNSSCGETEMPIFISKWMDSWHALYLEMYRVYQPNFPNFSTENGDIWLLDPVHISVKAIHLLPLIA